MKKILLLLAIVPAVAFGQGIRDYEARLGVPNSEGASIVVSEIGGAAAIGRLPEGNKYRKVTAYRVEIFSDNTASARERAYHALARFREVCPDVPTNASRDIRYDSPKYTVRVGMMLTHEEALVLCGRLRGAFAAYPRTEQMSLSVFESRGGIIASRDHGRDDLVDSAESNDYADSLNVEGERDYLSED